MPPPPPLDHDHVGVALPVGVVPVTVGAFGGVTSYVYAADATPDKLPARSHVITFKVVVAAGIVTLVGWAVEAVPDEHVGVDPLVVYRNSLKLASAGIPC